jgi:hypothetical protein
MLGQRSNNKISSMKQVSMIASHIQLVQVEWMLITTMMLSVSTLTTMRELKEELKDKERLLCHNIFKTKDKKEWNLTQPKRERLPLPSRFKEILTNLIVKSNKFNQTDFKWFILKVNTIETENNTEMNFSHLIQHSLSNTRALHKIQSKNQCKRFRLIIRVTKISEEPVPLDKDNQI